MQKKNRANTLFYAENNPLLLAIIPGIFYLAFVVVTLVQWRRGLIQSTDALLVNYMMLASVWAMWFAARQRIILNSDHFCSILGAFKKRVFYADIRSIALCDFIGDHVFLSFELRKNRYSPVRDVAIPRADCREILQILAREAPQAEMDDFAARWRDNRAY